MMNSTDIRVMTYICEEVRRQGHDLSVDEDGGVRVRGMLKAWQYALNGPTKPTLETVRLLGHHIEARNNRHVFRTCRVVIAGRVKSAERLDERVSALLNAWDDMEPLALYREFEEIHPFEDGNGRTGKVLLNWRNGTLEAPIFPPRDFWGQAIQNP